MMEYYLICSHLWYPEGIVIEVRIGIAQLMKHTYREISSKQRNALFRFAYVHRFERVVL